MKLNLINSGLRVCVDRVEGGHVCGRVYSERLEEPLEFQGVGNFLLQAEDLMDRQNFPRAFQRKRSFQPEEVEAVQVPVDLEGDFMSKEAVEAAQGPVGTFWVNVQTRQNTDWQGNVDWLDGEPPVEFASALELIRLVDQRYFTKTT